MPNKTYRRFYMHTKTGILRPIRYWAEENKKYFPRYGFKNRNSDFPITHEIALVLEKELDFIRLEEGNRVILYPSAHEKVKHFRKQ